MLDTIKPKTDMTKALHIVDQVTEGLAVDVEQLREKLMRTLPETPTPDDVRESVIKRALEMMDEANPDWTYVASRAYLEELYQQASLNRGYDAAFKYGDFLSLIRVLTEKGIYTTSFLEKYSEEEINQFGREICADRDLLFNYLGLHTLATRYLAIDHDKNTFELPQERWMIIAMHLMQDETVDKRTELVLEAYWALSNLYMTVATPTLTNAGKTHGRLSSCF
ncbi:MAG TPA: ribonucleotide reductase N-terminal alpha domain-containing protein, partial [Bacillota bacterium]|nr:ribonucleotide reductase N-terminal alpha domain-containing protein [Bacillota bacterium]